MREKPPAPSPSHAGSQQMQLYLHPIPKHITRAILVPASLLSSTECGSHVFAQSWRERFTLLEFWRPFFFCHGIQCIGLSYLGFAC